MRFVLYYGITISGDEKIQFGDPHGCLLGKYKPFGKKFSSLAGKKTQKHSAQDLKIHWEILFLTLLNIGQNAFRLGHFSRSKIESKSIFLIKYYIFTILNFVWAFRPKSKKVKKLISIVFSNLGRKGSGFFFQARKLIFFAKWLVLTY